MAYEVELKAYCDDPEELERILLERGRFVRSYLKEDVYFRFAGTGRDQDVRIRRDGGDWSCTFKYKTISDGVEINDEHEFSVDNGAELENLLLLFGCTELVRKTKRGKAFDIDGLTVELSFVDRIGYFVEIEKIVADAGQSPAATEDVRACLRSLGVDESRIEPLPYIRLLGVGRAAD